MNVELCPICLQQGQLVPSSAGRRARGCGTCGGRFFSRDDAYQLVVVDAKHAADAVGAALTMSTPTDFRCADCGEALSLVHLSSVPVGLCGACGGAWFWRGDEERLLAAASEPAPFNPFSAPSEVETVAFTPPPVPLPSVESPAPPPAPPQSPARAASHGFPEPALDDVPPAPLDTPAPQGTLDPPTPATGPRALRVGKPAPSPTAAPAGTRGAPLTAQGTAAPRRPTPLLAGGAVALVLVLGGLAFGVSSLFGGDAPPPPPDEESPGELAERAKADKYRTYFNHYAFGGRTVDWWSERLTTLRPGGPGADERLYQLTVERAERAGLRVEPARNGVVVTLSPETTALLLERLGIE